MLGSEGSFERVFGWVCLFIVLGLFLSSYILSSMYILIPLIHSNTITIICCILLSISTISLCLSLVYYFKARFSNPGKLPRHFSEVPADLRKLEDPVYHQTCKKCKDAWKPPRAYHCKVCNTCIMKMDHHCVWISNCVGAGNSKAFLQFVSAAFVYNFSFAMATIVACLNVIGYLGGRKLIVYATVSDFELVVCFLFIMYFLIACIFIFFTWDFFEDFKAGIQKNQTAVEEAKDRFGVKYPAHHLLEMFIGSGYIDWMSVKNPKKTHNYLERTYTLDDMVDSKDEFEVYHLSGIQLFRVIFFPLKEEDERRMARKPKEKNTVSYIRKDFVKDEIYG